MTANFAENQRVAILDWLSSGKTITPLEAENAPEIRSIRLAARIKELRKQGYPIVTEMIQVPSGKRVAQYHLLEKPQEATEGEPTTEDTCHIPEKMLTARNWVSRGGDNGKRPYGKSNDPTTWKSYQEAVAERNGAISYAIEEGQGICCIDLDGCISPDNVVHPKAQEILDRCQSYTEVSMSGKGLHIFGEITMSRGNRHPAGSPVEAYFGLKFIAFSGNVFQGRCELENIDEGIEWLYNTYFPRAEEGAYKKASDHYQQRRDQIEASRISDRDLYNKIAMSKQGPKFLRLWRGDTAGYETHSDADFALFGILRWWTGGDVQRMANLFRASGLFRPEKGGDYPERSARESVRRNGGR